MALIVAMALAVALTPCAGAIASRIGLVDRPGPLKVHAAPVPYLGGVAVLAAIAGPVAVTRPSLLVPLAMATALGVVDDAGDVAPPARLGAEIATGVVAGLVLPGTGVARVLLTVGAVVVLVNAVNLLDGLDGLAASVTLASFAGCAWAVSGSERTLAFAMVGALAGFLVWNRPPARVYLGDAGSYLVGTALALCFVGALRVDAPTAAGAVLFVAVPVADTTIAIVRRLRARRPLFQGDRGHVYDQLVDRGMTPLRATLACVAAQAALTVLGAFVGALPTAAAIAVVAGVVLVVGATALVVFTAPATWLRDV